MNSRSKLSISLALAGMVGMGTMLTPAPDSPPAAIWTGVKRLNTYIEETAPWTLNKRNETARLAAVLANAVEGLRIFAILLKPFIPASAEGMWEQIGLSQQANFHDLRLDTAKQWEYVPLGNKVNVGTPLFPRKEIPE